MSGRAFLVALLVMFLFFSGLSAYGGYRFYEATNKRVFIEPNTIRSASRLVRDDRRRVDEAMAAVDVLVKRLAALESRAVRVDSIARQIAKLSNLNVDEFGDASPGVGGAAPSNDNGYDGIHRDLEDLDRMLGLREYELLAIERLILAHNLDKELIPSGRPINEGWLSSSFGKRRDPFTGRRDWHEGLDFASHPGTEILAAGAGVVIWSGKFGGYGYMVEIDHGNGYTTRYGHNRKNLVKVGDIVKRGQAIAEMGSTGRSTGPHVHFEVRLDGKAVNPKTLLSSN